MISYEEVEKTIIDLEQRDTTYAVCERLAWLYIVRDHLVPAAQPATVSAAGSEFLDAVSGKDINAVLGVVDQHLQAVKAVYPKEYDAVIRLIREL